MAYAALLSTKQTILRIVSSYRNSILSCPEIKRAYRAVVRLMVMHGQGHSLENISWSSEREFADLERRIREAVCKFEDMLECHVSNQLLSQSESLGDETHPLTFTLNLSELSQEIDSFTKTVKNFEKEHFTVDVRPIKSLPEEDYVVRDFGGKNSKMVVLHDELCKLKDRLTSDDSDGRDNVVPIVGMAGIGKTTLANQVYGDPLIVEHFECRAWITVGPKYQLKQILLCILAQINPEAAKNRQEIDKELGRHVYRALKAKRYLVVLDDIWNESLWRELQQSFPKDDGGNRIMLTTRLVYIAEYCTRHRIRNVHKIRFLNEEESWHLLRVNLFHNELCPLELEKAGKKIAEICEGLPLAIIAAGNHLSRAEKTLEYWNKVATKEIPIFNGAADEITILEVLYSSYKYLPQHLKACYLYMGVFPQGYEIPASKLTNLLRAEVSLIEEGDLLVPSDPLKELVSRSLVLVRQQSSSDTIKTCKLHYIFQHMCVVEAAKDKFFHILSRHANSFGEGIRDQQGLCIHNNILFAIKDVYNSMASVSATVRSLLCTGPHHQYPVPMCFVLRLIRVLDALTIRFYNFPIEVLKLLQLRYLAFTYDGKLPASISKLWNLQYLIVRPHLSIKSPEARSYLPQEIWNMQALRHLQVMGSDLPDPPRGACLPNLLSLLDINAHSLTKAVLEGIPSIKKLGIQIVDLALINGADQPFYYSFDLLARLHGLESLKCVIVNPNPRSQFVGPPTYFPSNLNKLTLSGFGYPWKYMNTIAKLSNLKVLKLKCYAFRGPKWEVKGFWKLKFLLIEDTDLEYWETYANCFPRLERLSIRHCYKLKVIRLKIKHSQTLQKIELVDCSTLAVAAAKRIQDEQLDLGNDELQVYVHFSGDDGKLKA